MNFDTIYELRVVIPDAGTMVVPVERQLDGVMKLLQQPEAAELVRTHDQKVIVAKGRGRLRSMRYLTTPK